MAEKRIDPDRLEKNSRWRKPGYRSIYKLESAGEKFVTLKPETPTLRRLRISREEFLASDWSRV